MKKKIGILLAVVTLLATVTVTVNAQTTAQSYRTGTDGNSTYYAYLRVYSSTVTSSFQVDVDGNEDVYTMIEGNTTLRNPNTGVLTDEEYVVFGWNSSYYYKSHNNGTPIYSHSYYLIDYGIEDEIGVGIG